MLNHSNINLHIFDDRAAMVDALVHKTIDALKHDIDTHGLASWAVSGGSTPKPLFEAISPMAIAWEQVQIALVDERWVPQSHARNNETFVRSSLLKNKASAAQFTGMFQETGSAKTALSNLEESYGQLAQPFSNILLGIGNDGHTASLFPGAEGLEAALSPENNAICAAINAIHSDVTGAETERASLTFNAINKAKSCFLMITGDEKMATLSRALETDINLPIARVINMMDRPMDIFWAP
jgi:6-phosphogluconolactonase